MANKWGQAPHTQGLGLRQALEILRLQSTLGYNRVCNRLGRLPLLGPVLARQNLYGRLGWLHYSISVLRPILRLLMAILFRLALYIMLGGYIALQRLFHLGVQTSLNTVGSLSLWSYIANIWGGLLELLQHPAAFSQAVLALVFVSFLLQLRFNDALFGVNSRDYYLIRYLRLDPKALFLSLMGLRTLRAVLINLVVFFALQQLGLLRLGAYQLLLAVLVGPLVGPVNGALSFLWKSHFSRLQKPSRQRELFSNVCTTGYVLLVGLGFYLLVTGSVELPSWLFNLAGGLLLLSLVPLGYGLWRQQNYRSYYLKYYEEQRAAVAEVLDTEESQESKRYLESLEGDGEPQYHKPQGGQTSMPGAVFGESGALPISLGKAAQSNPYKQLEALWRWRSRRYLRRTLRVSFCVMVGLTLLAAGARIYVFLRPEANRIIESWKEVGLICASLLYLRSIYLSGPLMKIQTLRYHSSDRPLLGFSCYRDPQKLSQLRRARLGSLIHIFRWQLLCCVLSSFCIASLIADFYGLQPLEQLLCSLLAAGVLLLLSLLELYAQVYYYFAVDPSRPILFYRKLRSTLFMIAFIGGALDRLSMMVLPEVLGAPLVILYSLVCSKWQKRPGFYKRPDKEEL